MGCGVSWNGAIVAIAERRPDRLRLSPHLWAARGWGRCDIAAGVESTAPTPAPGGRWYADRHETCPFRGDVRIRRRGRCGKVGYLAAIATQGFRLMFEARIRAMRDLHDPRERLISVMLAHLRFSMAHPALYRVMFGAEVPAKAQPALNPTGEAKCQEIRPEEAMPVSQGCPVMTAVPSASTSPLKIEATTDFCVALRQLPSRAPVQVGTSRCRSKAAWQASVSCTRPSSAPSRRNGRAQPSRRCCAPRA